VGKGNAYTGRYSFFAAPMTQSSPNTDNKIRNISLAMAAAAVSAGLFFATRNDAQTLTAAKVAERAIPLEQAQTNGKPSLVEFYAEWCTSCNSMAPTIAAMEEKYRGKINFVALNVDNEKWVPEAERYQVSGIPHYVFIDANGKILGNLIGEQTNKIFDTNLKALSGGKAIPYAQAQPGQTSTFKKNQVKIQ
jgi:thiol-disulfide isomerase/thioredoxin